MALDVPGMGPVCVVRGKDGVIRAFNNVCKHRGAKLLQETSGEIQRITCPYHAWTFATDGRLVAAPTMKNCTKFEKKDYGLDLLELENVDGFLFLRGKECPPLSKFLGNLPDLLLSTWSLKDWVTVGRAEYIVKSNWKYVFENTAETYHTPVVHSGTLGAMPSSPCRDVLGEPVGHWDAIHIPYERSVVPLPGEPAPFPEVAPTTYFTNIFPSLQLNLTKDCAWWMRMLPMGVDKTKVVQGFLFPPETTKLPDFKTNVAPYLERWRLAVTEDNMICENQQAAAISTTANNPGPYSDLEFGTYKFDNFVLDRVLQKA